MTSILRVTLSSREVGLHITLYITKVRVVLFLSTFCYCFSYVESCILHYYVDILNLVPVYYITLWLQMTFYWRVCMYGILVKWDYFSDINNFWYSINTLMTFDFIFNIYDVLHPFCVNTCCHFLKLTFYEKHTHVCSFNRYICFNTTNTWLILLIQLKLS